MFLSLGSSRLTLVTPGLRMTIPATPPQLWPNFPSSRAWKFLLDKTSLDCIQKENRDHSYVPTNNVKEAKHKIGSVKMKKPVMVKDIRKLFSFYSE